MVTVRTTVGHLFFFANYWYVYYGNFDFLVHSHGCMKIKFTMRNL
jgi:hypothetical protein